ncbi:HEAT repeat domain-containing protein [Sorangium sp. So ce1099]|uniref:HEAT repeat domain-containing protein n=1 Tax=Sorangium sp. So ce1099 TaxID=3133331 RepID=UPI003F5D8A13
MSAVSTHGEWQWKFPSSATLPYNLKSAVVEVLTASAAPDGTLAAIADGALFARKGGRGARPRHNRRLTARRARPNLPGVESYASIASQPESALRELLDHESPQVRLHAAWALGLCKGQEFLGDIASRAGREPSAGVRQHFMIMLAGGREKAAIATFAALDPDALVRATACQYLARLVEPSDLPFYDALLDRAEHDPEDDVRCAAIQHLRADAPAAVRNRILEGFPRGSLAFQQAVAGRLAAWSETPRAFLGALTGASPALLVHALGLLREQSTPIPWGDLAPHARHHDAAVLLQIAHLLRDAPERAPITFWASIAGHWDAFWQTSPETQEMLVGALERAVAHVVPGELPAEVRQHLADLRRHVESSIRRGRWGSSFLEEWYDIGAMLKRPEMAKTGRLESPVGRLMAQLILVTPDYEGFTQEERLAESKYWLL